MSQHNITAEEKKLLEERLEYLKTEARKEIAERIKEARAFGDISENAEYDAAKEEQAIIEGEILELESKLRTAVVVNEGAHDTSTVSVGCTVTLLDMEYNENVEYRIVGGTSSDPANKKLSLESPVGKALLGRKKGDIVDVKTPSGTIVKYKILKIK